MQLAGCDPHVMAEAAKLNEQRGAAIIDINMGCPVKKVVNGEAGSALMRDLGLAAVTHGRIGAKHIRALKPMAAPTGWHWHDMTAHYVFVLRGSLTFRFAGVVGDVTLQAGDGLSQPAGVPHNVVARSDDLEVIEINEPAEYGTWDLTEAPEPWR